MAQYRPRPADPGDEWHPRDIPVSRDGWTYTVPEATADSVASAAGEAISDLATLSDHVPLGPGPGTVWDEIGWRGVQSAAADAGVPRSRSTIYKWVRNARTTGQPLPPGVAELAQRRAFVARHGGVEALADLLGTSAATVSRWQTGHTATMRGHAGAELERALLADALRRAGRPPIRGARIHVTADIEIRHDGDAYQESSRVERSILVTLGERDAQDIAVAWRRGDHGTATMLIEAAWTAEWGTLGYSDAEGVHITEAANVTVAWT